MRDRSGEGTTETHNTIHVLEVVIEHALRAPFRLQRKLKEGHGIAYVVFLPTKSHILHIQIVCGARQVAIDDLRDFNGPQKGVALGFEEFVTSCAGCDGSD